MNYTKTPPPPFLERNQPRNAELQESIKNATDRTNINIRVNKVVLNFINEFKSKIESDFHAQFGRKMTQNDALVQAIFYYTFDKTQYNESYMKTVGEELMKLRRKNVDIQTEKLAMPTVDPKNPTTFNNKPESFGVTLADMEL